jgi:hypothetical protein
LGLVVAGGRSHTAVTISSFELADFRHRVGLKEKLTYKRHTVHDARTMGILTVRLTAEEELLLDRRSRKAGMKKATFVRQLIREEPFITASDVLVDAAMRMGDSRLRISRK